MQPTIGQTVTLAPDAASWAATPATTVEIAADAATVPAPDQTSTCPPVTAADVAVVNGVTPPE
jgi:hypothetical protein